MNARGKQLSGYENFKADLINWMKSKTNLDYSRFNQDVTYRGREMKYYMAFAQKLDNEWTDIFWDAIKDNKDTESSLDGKVVDNMFMRFFIRFFFNEKKRKTYRMKSYQTMNSSNISMEIMVMMSVWYTTTMTLMINIKSVYLSR
jgi:hypothetical protein